VRRKRTVHSESWPRQRRGLQRSAHLPVSAVPGFLDTRPHRDSSRADHAARKKKP
jgi:hypothetical protein